MDIPTSKSVDCTVSDGTKKIPTGRIPTKRMKGMSDKAFTHKTAENARPGDKPYKLSTGRGFYLLGWNDERRSVAVGGQRGPLAVAVEVLLRPRARTKRERFAREIASHESG